MPRRTDRPQEESARYLGGQGNGSDSNTVVAEDASSANPDAYVASIYPTRQDLKLVESGFGDAVRKIQETLGCHVRLLVQSAPTREDIGSFSPTLVEAFIADLTRIDDAEDIAIIIDSGGGYAEAAYRLGRMLERREGRFTALIPRYAKSAATLLCLGADVIVMSDDAELGPLDTQVKYDDQGPMRSALDEVQSLDHLSLFASEAVDRRMRVLFSKYQHDGVATVKTLLPQAHAFVSSMVRPLYENINVLHWTRMARALKVHEEYALRLLRPNYGGKAEGIARRLVHSYPEHAFVIDRVEASEIGLNVKDPRRYEVEDRAVPELATWMDELVPFLRGKGSLVHGELFPVQLKLPSS